MHPTLALSRLLSERSLREAFRADPAGVCAALGVAPEERGLLTELEPEQLEVQARGLLLKRLREVRKLLPRTVEALGSDGEALFLSYAEGGWPTTHRRHALDAVGFGDWLRGRQHPALDAAEVERARFLARDRRVALGWIQASSSPGRSSRALQLLWRWRGVTRQRLLRVAWPG